VENKSVPFFGNYFEKLTPDFFSNNGYNRLEKVLYIPLEPAG
jgi:hypothetical protein